MGYWASLRLIGDTFPTLLQANIQIELGGSSSSTSTTPDVLYMLLSDIADATASTTKEKERTREKEISLRTREKEISLRTREKEIR